MKKTTVIAGTVFLFFTAFAFCTEVTTGITYDTHEGTFLLGTDFSLKETFKDKSSFSTGLAYKNAGSYSASLMYNKILNTFILSGGLNYTINKTEIVPFIIGGAGVIFSDISLITAGGLNLNPDNLFDPDKYTCSADLIFDTGESIIDLSFLYYLKKAAEGIMSKIGGGMIFTAYQQGAPAEIDLITNVTYITDEIDGNDGLAVDAGAGINVNLPFMSIKLKAMAYVMDPRLADDAAMPYSISLTTGFKL